MLKGLKVGQGALKETHIDELFAGLILPSMMLMI